MNRYIAVWALIALAAQSSYSSEPLKSDEDTALVKSEAIELAGITVKSQTRIQKPDRMVFLPKREVVRTSTDGIDFLRKVRIPGVSINPLTGEISVSGGREVELRLNGVLVSNVELAGVQPSEIIRIEYNDNPGTGGAESRVIINYVVRKPGSGGYIGFDSFDAIGKDKFASISHLSCRYARGQSCVSVNAGYCGMTRDGWIRDYEETWHLPTGDISRLEQGLPVKIGMHGVDSYLNYNLSGEGKYLFNARLGLDYNYVPNKEEGDRHTLLFIDGETTPREITEHTSERSWTPSANLFYRMNLSDISTLTLELTGAHMTSSSLHSYAEYAIENAPQEVQYEASGRKSSLRSEGKWTLGLGKGELSTGFRDEYDRIRNVYTGDTYGAINLEQNVASVFGSYGASLGM